MIDYALIVRLRKQGMSINAIASAAGCKWDTVSRILLRCEEKWDSVDNVPDGLGAQEIKDQILSPGSVINREYLQPDPEKILERQRKEGKSRLRRKISIFKENPIKPRQLGIMSRICCKNPQSRLTLQKPGTFISFKKARGRIFPEWPIKGEMSSIRCSGRSQGPSPSMSPSL